MDKKLFAATLLSGPHGSARELLVKVRSRSYVIREREGAGVDVFEVDAYGVIAKAPADTFAAPMAEDALETLVGWRRQDDAETGRLRLLVGPGARAHALMLGEATTLAENARDVDVPGAARDVTVLAGWDLPPRKRIARSGKAAGRITWLVACGIETRTPGGIDPSGFDSPVTAWNVAADRSCDLRVNAPTIVDRLRWDPDDDVDETHKAAVEDLFANGTLRVGRPRLVRLVDDDALVEITADGVPRLGLR